MKAFYIKNGEMMPVRFPLINPKYYWQLIKDLVHFIKTPMVDLSVKKTVNNKICDTIGLFFIKVVFSITVASLVQFIYEPENLTSISMAERFSPFLLLLVGGIILPIFEEVTFRLSLKFNPIYLSLTSGTFTYYIITKAFFKSRLSIVDDTFWDRVLIAAFILSITYVISSRESIKLILQRWWKKHFNKIYYFSCVSFAWLHIFNFEINLINLLWLPVLTLPQLFSAAIAGYTRMVFGFQYPLILHTSTNVLFISLTFLPFD